MTMIITFKRVFLFSCFLFKAVFSDSGFFRYAFSLFFIDCVLTGSFFEDTSKRYDIDVKA